MKVFMLFGVFHGACFRTITVSALATLYGKGSAQAISRYRLTASSHFNKWHSLIHANSMHHQTSKTIGIERKVFQYHGNDGIDISSTSENRSLGKLLALK